MLIKRPTIFKIVKRALVCVALLCCAAGEARAQLSVSVPDYSVADNRPANVVLKISGELPQSTNARLTFKYDASRINIKSAAGGAGKVIPCISPVLSSSADETVGFFSVQCDLPSGGKGELFDLNIEILAGRDSIARIIPDSVFIDGQARPMTAKTGIISIGDLSVKQVIAEGIEQNFPNPFNTSTSFYYNIDAETPVHLRVYTSIGKLAIDYAVFQQSRGRHKFFINTDPGELGAGAYYILMTTNKGSYILHLICAK